MLTSHHRFTTYQSMRTDLWGQQKGILIVCFLLSKFKQRSLNVAASSRGRGYFRKRSSCGRGYFYTDERYVFKIIRIRMDEALVYVIYILTYTIRLNEVLAKQYSEIRIFSHKKRCTEGTQGHYVRICSNVV